MSTETLIGQTIGNYEIVDRLGKGGMATVYRARQLSMQRDVAIKIMSGELADDPQFVARFEREAQVIANLQHPRILPVHDFGHVGETFYLVMRAIEGTTLHMRLNDGALPLSTAARFLNQIAEALDYAHSQGVVHRDLKPTNVLIDAWDNLYLMDFGLAKMLASSTHLTASGAVLGTPAYMAPEQWRGEVVDARSDVYALGVILYEMVTGRAPFESDTPYTLMYKHINDAPMPPREIVPALPEQVEAVILKALAKQKGDRYPSAGDLARAFTQILQAEQIEGHEALSPPSEPVVLRGDARPQSDPALKPDDAPHSDAAVAAAAGVAQADLPPVEAAPAEKPTDPDGLVPSMPPIPVPAGERPPQPPRPPEPDIPRAQRPTPKARLDHPTPPSGARDLVEQVKSSSMWQGAMDVVERGLETALEHAAESAPVSDHDLMAADSAGLPVASLAYEQMSDVLRPNEQLVGVLDVRGTPQWTLWKYLLIGGLALNVFGGIVSATLFSTLGVLAWLFVFVQGVRTWRGNIGRYYIGFTPERVIFLPRDEDGMPDLDEAQAAGWGVIDRLRLAGRYMLMDVPNPDHKDFHFAGLVLAYGEGGLGAQANWLPGSPITALIAAEGFDVADELR